MKNNIIWIDWVKSICIFFVYYLHVDTFGEWTKYTPIPYGAFFVNAFFFVSGYLMLGKILSETYEARSFVLVRNRYIEGVFCKIAIPSILFSCIDFIPKIVVRGGGFSISTLLFDATIRGTHWFTCALCVAQLLLLLFCSIKIFNGIWKILAASIFLFGLGWMLNYNDFTLFGDKYAPWFYKSGLMATLFVALGGLYWKYEKEIDRIALNKSWIPIVLFLAYILIAKNLKHQYATSVLQGIDIPGIIISLFAIISVISICKLLPEYSIIKWIGRHTIGFYFFSASIPFVLAKSFNMITSSPIAFYACVLLAFFVSGGGSLSVRQIRPICIQYKETHW